MFRRLTNVLHKTLLVGIAGATLLGTVNIVNGIFYKISLVQEKKK